MINEQDVASLFKTGLVIITYSNFIIMASIDELLGDNILKSSTEKG